MVILIIWAAFGAWGYYIGKGKGRATTGLVLGVLLGIFGVAIIACLKPIPAQPQYGAPPAPYAPVQPRQPANWAPPTETNR